MKVEKVESNKPISSAQIVHILGEDIADAMHECMCVCMCMIYLYFVCQYILEFQTLEMLLPEKHNKK